MQKCLVSRFHDQAHLEDRPTEDLSMFLERRIQMTFERRDFTGFAWLAESIELSDVVEFDIVDHWKTAMHYQDSFIDKIRDGERLEERLECSESIWTD